MNKTNYKANTQVQIQIDGVDIERVHEYKFPGVTIDEGIIWQALINHVQSKVSRGISVLLIHRNGLKTTRFHFDVKDFILLLLLLLLFFLKMGKTSKGVYT